jgi:hypothetical protein
VWLGAALLACLPASCGPAGRPADDGWVSLSGPDCRRRWTTVQGRAEFAGERIVLNPDVRGRSTIVAPGVSLRNGAIDVAVRRLPGGVADAPYTFGLRTTCLWAWRSIYFVCRPDHVDVCRGHARDHFPARALCASYPPADGPERWRFVMREGVIDCYRFDEKVISYPDDDIRRGTLALTADSCALEIIELRYRPAATKADR